MANQPCCANPKVGKITEIYTLCDNCKRLIDELDASGKPINYLEVKRRHNEEAEKRDREKSVAWRGPKS